MASKCSNLARSTILGFCLKFSPVKYLYLSRFPDDRANILAAALSKLYRA